MKCENCGELFEPKRKTAKYCSDKCRVYAKRNIKPLAVANVTVKTKPEEIIEIIKKQKPDVGDWKLCTHGWRISNRMCPKGCTK